MYDVGGLSLSWYQLTSFGYDIAVDVLAITVVFYFSVALFFSLVYMFAC